MSAATLGAPAVDGAEAQGTSRRTLWREIGRLLLEFCRAQPVASLALLVVVLVGNSRTALYLLAIGGLVDALVSGTGRGQPALFWVGVYVAGQAIEEVYWPLKGYVSNILRDHGTYRIQRDVLRRAAGAPLIRFEERAFFDHLQRAAAGTGERLATVYASLVDLVQVLLMLAGTALALATVDPLLLPILAGGALPALWLQTRTVRIGYDIHRTHTTRDRVRTRLEGLLTGREAAGEIRLFGAADYLWGRWRRLRDERARDVAAGDRRRALFTTGGNLAMGAAYAAALVLTATLILDGRATIGGFAAVATGALWFQGTLSSVINVATTLEEQSPFLGDLFDFRRIAGPEPSARPTARGAVQGGARTAVQGANGDATRVQEDTPGAAVAVEAEGVTFAYPGSAEPVLRDVSLRLAPGERVAIVGENGAGKTTLVKLLLGLYQPDAGAVRIDGAPLTPERAPAVRHRIAAVFQDFAAFELTLRENVGFGDVDRMGDDRALASAVERAGLTDLLTYRPRGFDAFLGRQFGEADLSGGQWQRVALARAFFRRAGLLILDEPTAALDPLAELALFERFAALVEGRTAVMISHRLGMARLAGRVVVLQGGRIVEDGPHDRLVAAGGPYARLFAAQAQWYR